MRSFSPRPGLPLLRLLGRLPGRLVRLLGPTPGATRQSLVALGLNSSTSLVAGAVLGSITPTLERYPGLLVLVPAAIGLRGNVFSALGNRLSTAVHTGMFRLTLRPGSLLGQNVIAALVLTMAMSFFVAGAAKVVAVGLHIEGTISLLQLALVSILGGMLASLAVLAATVALAGGSVRYGWDLDNVTAPLVSTLGDVLTLPALWLATFVLTVRVFASLAGLVTGVVAVAVLLVTWRSPREILRQVVRESTPILLVAVFLSTLAGVAIERRLDVFARFPALLVLLPAFISSAGALGGILSSRLSTKLHLGLLPAGAFPSREARLDGASVFLLGAPVFLFNAVGAHLTAAVLHEASPGLVEMVAASMLAGAVAVAFAVAVAYYGTVASFRLGLDPDTYGVPVVTSSVDFLGAVTLIVTIVALGIT
ncbi:MAG: magnesium transporter [Acidimicrobiia bacterium]